MAKDDYHVIIYNILAYLYTQLKRGKAIDTKYLMPNGKLFQINDKYYTYIMKNLKDTGLVSGIDIVEDMTGIYVDDLDQIEITPKGIEYLLDNRFIEKAKQFLKDIKEVTPFI